MKGARARACRLNGCGTSVRAREIERVSVCVRARRGQLRSMMKRHRRRRRRRRRRHTRPLDASTRPKAASSPPRHSPNLPSFSERRELLRIGRNTVITRSHCTIDRETNDTRRRLRATPLQKHQHPPRSMHRARRLGLRVACEGASGAGDGRLLSGGASRCVLTACFHAQKGDGSGKTTVEVVVSPSSFIDARAPLSLTASSNPPNR